MMDIIMGDRQSGRTTKLIELCAEAERQGEIAYIVCLSHEEAYRIVTYALDTMGLQIPFPMTYLEFLQGQYNAKQLYIDNADHLLEYIAKANIAAITMEFKEV